MAPRYREEAGLRGVKRPACVHQPPRAEVQISTQRLHTGPSPQPKGRRTLTTGANLGTLLLVWFSMRDRRNGCGKNSPRAKVPLVRLSIPEGSCPPVPGREGKPLLLLRLLLWATPCARCFTAELCQISPPCGKHPSQSPKGGDLPLATVVHDPGPQIGHGGERSPHFTDEEAEAWGG